MISAEKEQQSFRTLHYYGNIPKKIAKILPEECNIDVAFTTDNTLRKHLIKTKDKLPFMKKPGVYCLSCNDCDCV